MTSDERSTQETKPQPQPPQRVELREWPFYAGLAVMGTGLAFTFSWSLALIVVGAVVVLVSVASAFAVTTLQTLIEALQLLKRGK